MSRMPIVSVIIPVYNAEKYIRECLESLIKQTYKNWEAICINDGSEDNSTQIISDLMKSDSRIKLYSKNNEGPSAARNYGLKKSIGELIMKLDADDFVSHNYIQSALERLKETQADAAISDMYLYISPTEKYRHVKDATTGKIDFLKDMISAKEAVIRSIKWDRIHSYLVIKRNIYKGVTYNTSGVYGDEVTERLLISKCKTLCYFPGNYYYRFHSNSLTQKVNVKRFDLCLSYVQTKELCKNMGIYSECKKEVETQLLNMLKVMQRYYHAHRYNLSKVEKKKAKEQLKNLFMNLDYRYLIKIHEEKGFIWEYVFKIKLLSYPIYFWITRLQMRLF